MTEFGKYPENRLDIRMDENGHMTFEQNAEFKKYYAPTRGELEEKLEELQYRLDLLETDEPDDILSVEHEEWEDEVNDLQERIREIKFYIKNYIKYIDRRGILWYNMSREVRIWLFHRTC